MLWGRNNRFTSKNVFHASPDPACLSPNPAHPSEPYVNFTALLRSQLKSSSSMFRASSLWAENSLELPVTSPQRHKNPPAGTQAAQAGPAGASKKKKAKKLRKKTQDMHGSAMFSEQAFIMPRIIHDDDSQVTLIAFTLIYAFYLSDSPPSAFL